MRGRKVATATLFLCLYLGIAATSAYAAAKPATEKDRDEIESAGLKYVPGMLWDKDNPYVGIEASEAKRYLIKKLSNRNYKTIYGLNAEFACRLARFLKAAEVAGYGNIRIGNGFRTHQEQITLYLEKPHLAARPGTSLHEYGQAADLEHKGAAQSWAHANAARFGLRYLRSEPWHVEASRSTPDGARCGDLGAGSDLKLGSAPSSGITGSARDLLGQQEMCTLSDGTRVQCNAIANRAAPVGTPQQTLPASQQPQLQQAPPLGAQNTTAYAPGTCAPQFYCMNNVHYYRSSACVDQVYQRCPAGCSETGNACASTSTSATLSTSEKIDLIAEPTSTPQAVSDILFALSFGNDDIATIREKKTEAATSATDALQYVPPPPASQQTFTSSDLQYSQAQTYSPQELSGLQRTLAIMKDTLLRALAYLRPFSARAPSFNVNELPGE